MERHGDKLCCRECGDLVDGHGSKALQLCNKHYIKYRRGATGHCTSCDRETKIRRVQNPICADCEAKEYALRYLAQQSERFSRIPITPVERRLRELWEHLLKWYGDRPKPIWEAFYPTDDLLTSGQISLDASWEQLEAYRKAYRGLKVVRYKAALYAYMEFLSMTGRLEDRDGMLFHQSYRRIAEDVLPSFKRIFMDYVKFCLTERQLSKWTLYLECDDIRDFFVWLDIRYGSVHLAAIQTHHIREYIAYLSKKKSQRTLNITWNILRNFFKWAKLCRQVFMNPALGVKVKHGIKSPEGLSERDQRRLAKRWLDSGADPREAAVGLLAMVYGLSMDELRNLRIHELDLNAGRLNIASRVLALPLEPSTLRVLTRYIEYRKAQVAGSVTDYVFTSRFSLRYNRPMEQSAIFSVLRPAKVNTRQLRATCIIEMALTGNLKLLEAMGLTVGGSQAYIRVVQDALVLRQLDDFAEITNPKLGIHPCHRS